VEWGTFASKILVERVPPLIDDGDAGITSDCVERLAVRDVQRSERSAPQLALGILHQPAGVSIPQFG